MRDIFPNAKIGFSEILYFGRGNRNSLKNRTVADINRNVEGFCVERGFSFIKHELLQSDEPDLYDDEVHINRKGTAVLCANMYNAMESRVRPLNREAGHSGTRRFNGNTRPTQPNRARPFHQGRAQTDRLDIRSHNRPLSEDMDMDSMLRILTINMLQKFHR